MLPGKLRDMDLHAPFLIEDMRTHESAGARIERELTDHGTSYTGYIFRQKYVPPNEQSIGSALLHMDGRPDVIIGIGSGTVNDIGKIAASITGLPYISVATAPSMDGYSSPTSSLIIDGSKISIASTPPSIIIADTDILREAPRQMLMAGIGDMIAKYISICEWRISHLITGEYYCETIADMMRKAASACLGCAEGVMKRDPQAAAEVTHGLIQSGIAMMYAGFTRPAAGMEHYFSHLWDMRSLSLHTPRSLHGIQVCVGTMLTLRVYDMIRDITPSREKALSYVRGFDRLQWEACLRSLLGSASDQLIEREQAEGKYSITAHAQRLERILHVWPEILQIIDEELPPTEHMVRTLQGIGLPVSPEDIKVSRELAQLSFKATKDVRNCYIASRLLWDIGMLDEVAMKL